MSDQTATVLFMSQEHVDRMNALLVDSVEVLAACAHLPRPFAMAYRLADGPDGHVVHWRMSFGETVRFDLLGEPADVVLAGDWQRMIRASSAGRDGEVVDPGLTVEGDATLLKQVGPVLEVARGVATLPVHFPEV
jgi:hypothetical protein